MLDDKIYNKYLYYDFLYSKDISNLIELKNTSEFDYYINKMLQSTKDVITLEKIYIFLDRKEVLFKLLFNKDNEYRLMANIKLLKDNYNNQLLKYLKKRFYEVVAMEKSRDNYKKAATYVGAIHKLNDGEKNVNELISELKNTVLNKIIKHQDLFTRVEENVIENSASQRMNLQHFKFFFDSATDDSEKYILLDVAYEENKYPETTIKKIECSKINVASDIEVKLPTIESVIGDKLTVLATKTTGISYNSQKELELMKQLYDVDKLFDNAEDLNIVKSSFINIATREIEYRKLREITYEDVLDDIQDFCEDVILLRKEHLDKINIGMSKMSGFITEGKFLIDKEVLTAASKVLYLIKLIKNDENVIEKYYDGVGVNEVEIPQEYRKRLKRMSLFNEEAYYYIIKSLEK